jgi:hypothetical protein
VAATLALAAPALAWPPWISIEYPVNPFDRATRDALLLVRTYEHGEVSDPVTARAEGVVAGQHRTIPLQVTATGRVGEWAVTGSLPRGSSWVVIATLEAGGTEARPTALIGIAADGQLAAVRVPREPREGYVLPTAATAADIDAMLARATAATASAVPANAAAREHPGR